jgi:pimeloyl-ACP methyl ester carboxylesterase
VIPRLQRQGYTVVAPPNQLRGPSVDDPYLASYLQTISGPIILVGHSYGGFVITNAATGNANVKALVYIDAFIPDANQTLADLSSPESCLDPATAFNVVPFSGGVDLYLRIAPNPPYTGFNECFANGVHQPGRRAVRGTAAGGRGATGRAVRPAGLGRYPVVVLDRNRGPRGAAFTSGADVDPRGCAHLVRQSRSPGAHPASQRRGRHH